MLCLLGLKQYLASDGQSQFGDIRRPVFSVLSDLSNACVGGDGCRGLNGVTIGNT